MGRLLKAIADGNYLAPACAYAGISYRTFGRWMAKGKEAKSGKYRQFWQAVQSAKAKAEVTVVQLWRAKIPLNWQAARDFLALAAPVL